MTKSITGSVRVAVRGREAHRCLRCGTRGAEIHHRRSKAVVDAHQHCACNLVYLCGWGNHTGCHGWAHSQPFESRPLGFIVLRSVAEPGTIPIYSTPLKAWVTFTCDGHIEVVAPPEESA